MYFIFVNMSATKGLDHWADILIVIIYFVAVLAVGLWTLFRPNRGNVKSYFLAGRSMPWFAVGASLFSSNIGSEHFVGLAGAGATSGITMVLYEWFVIFLILALGWLFLPVYISAGVYTLPEYVEKRHGGRRIRTYLSCLAIVLYIITKLAVSIFAGSLFIQMALGWNMYLSIVVLLVITGLYTVLGGLAAVMYTDTFQTTVMTIGAFTVLGISFSKVGGMGELQKKYMESFPTIRNENSTCGQPHADAFHIFLDPVNGAYPWPGLVIQSSLGCLWYWCCDQVIVQRSLASKNLTNAKAGSILAGYLKLLPLFLLIFPGMISRVLFPDEVACVDPEECQKYCENPVGCSNIAYPKLILELLPIGLRGFMMAVMMAAIMSSLTSIFNSSSTVFTMDLWRRIRPAATQRELLIVGRVAVVVMCVISILWIPLVKSSQGGKLFTYMTAIEGYLGAPLGIVFLLSIFWRRTTETGAFWGLVIAHICGLTRLILEFVYPAPFCGEPETRPAILYKLHYLYFGIILLIITAIAVVVISLCTKPRSEEQLKGVTWWTRYQPKTVTTEEDVQLNDVKMTTEENPTETPFTEDHESLPRRLVKFICGIEDSHDSLQISIADRRAFMQQSPRWKQFLNVNAILLMGVIVFLTGFYH
ncbi:hypothetical protein KUTeg_021995 [Tegillarca granosa]|uniref:Sodium/glucose cotransporter 4 n=1 Tax=Tegillarca granosa TaxID=220873 RepID=A0ABQ9E9J0_TEGGR|nr:hypothetical protein KUTeg_021995 [Tegillarca granosa]